MELASNVVFVGVLVALSAIFSGLNIAIMSLDLPGLKRQSKLGGKRARRVYPLRKNAHLTLTVILIGNVAAAAAVAIALENSLNSGIYAGIISTMLLVLFGELLPQALFVKRALTICSFFSPLIRLLIILTYPIAKPLQLLLDRLVGEHADSKLHSRDELGLLIKEHAGHESSELDSDEVEIIKGALLLSEKKVESIMSQIRHVYWLTPETLIDADKIDEIKLLGWSRIPVLSKDLKRSHGFLRMKDLVDIDFDETSMKVKAMPLYPVEPVGSRTALDTMFRKFISKRTHLIPVEKNDRIVGIVTIEDLLEEIIGHEIIDESDHHLNRG